MRFISRADIAIEEGLGDRPKFRQKSDYFPYFECEYLQITGMLYRWSARDVPIPIATLFLHSTNRSDANRSHPSINLSSPVGYFYGKSQKFFLSAGHPPRKSAAGEPGKSPD